MVWCIFTLALCFNVSAKPNEANEKGHHTGKVEALKGFPSHEKGYEVGVSACFAGMLNGRLIMAGGCNFPTPEASAKGEKKYYKGIYMAKTNKGKRLKWHKTGVLPTPSAYGVSVTLPDKVVLIGGCNNSGSQAGVIVLSLNKDGTGVSSDTLPSLPCTLDNMAGAYLNGRLYVVGGNRNGKQSARMYSLNLNNIANGWEEEPPLPDNKPRVQPLCAAAGGRIYVWGGFANTSDSCEAEVFCTGFCYNPNTKEWQPTASPHNENGESITLSGGIAASPDGRLIVCAGGVDKHIFLDAISGRYELISPEAYPMQPKEWYKFNNRLLIYDTVKDKWEPVTLRSPLLGRAGAALTGTDYTLYYIGGELKPRVRIPEAARIMIYP